jgi:hypothetical protein
MVMMAGLFRSFLSLLVVAALLPISKSEAAPYAKALRATSFIPVQSTVGELTDAQLEQVLVSEIHKIADKAFAEIKAKDPHVKVTQLKKVERAVIHKLKETGKLIELARSLNPQIGVSVVAVELFVTLGLAPVLMANGHVLAGTIVMNFPSAPLLLSALLAYEVQKIRWQIGRELKTPVGELEKIRKEVIGYNIKHKITSLVLQDGEVIRELELVTKAHSAKLNDPEIVTLRQVEKIIGQTKDGESFLAHAYHERAHKEVYASLLLQYLNNSSESLSALLHNISVPNEANVETQKFPELRKHLIELADVQKHIDRELKVARKEISVTKKKVKRGELSKEEGTSVRSHLKEELARLQEVRVQSFRQQYTMLLAAKNAITKEQTVEVAKIVAKFKAELAELRVVGSFARIRERAQEIALPAEFKGDGKAAAQAESVIRTCEQVFARAN